MENINMVGYNAGSAGRGNKLNSEAIETSSHSWGSNCGSAGRGKK